MRYKDLGFVLRNCKKFNLRLQMNEFLHFTHQVVEALCYVTSVGMHDVDHLI